MRVRENGGHRLDGTGVRVESIESRSSLQEELSARRTCAVWAVCDFPRPHGAASFSERANKGDEYWFAESGGFRVVEIAGRNIPV